MIYELHVRDFSVSDETVSPAHRSKYLSFAEADFNGMHDLQTLAKAGLTHVHLLPTFDCASVPENPAAQKLPPDLSGFGPAGDAQQAAILDSHTGKPPRAMMAGLIFKSFSTTRVFRNRSGQRYSTMTARRTSFGRGRNRTASDGFAIMAMLDDITEKDIEDGLDFVAGLIDSHGDAYWPIFERLERELAERQSKAARLSARLAKRKHSQGGVSANRQALFSV